MLNSSNAVRMTNKPDQMTEVPPRQGLDLPVAPAWFSEPPRGSLDDGVRLSLLALEQIEGRSEVFQAREQHRCNVEFTL